MKKVVLSLIACVFVIAICITSCVHKPQVVINNGYPPAVSAIFISKCATAGCHDQASYQNSAGLLLDSWTHLFNGDNNGAEVVAYSTEFSPLLSYVNTNASLGLAQYDPNHFSPALTTAEYKILNSWIAAGAPDINGTIPFSGNASTRQKLYITTQPCNAIAVIDGQSKLIMRYIPVGDATDAAPHSMAISSDGLYGYVPFYNGSVVQKINTLADTVVSTVNLGAVVPGGTGGFWSIAMMSPLDTAFMVSGYESPGYIVTVNTAAMQVDRLSSIDANTGGTELLADPHGLASNAAFDTFYAALNVGNAVIKYWFKPKFGHKYDTINNKPLQLTTNDSTTPDPHQIMMSPDYSKYFVTCQTSGEVRVMDANTDTLISVISVGKTPQEMDIYSPGNYLFVTCMGDAANPNPGCLGSVYVIDLNTLKTVNILYGNFYQPHGIAVDAQDGFLFVVSTNLSGSSHHSTVCGKPGWYSVYDLNTLQPADNKQYNTASDPYTVSARFK